MGIAGGPDIGWVASKHRVVAVDYVVRDNPVVLFLLVFLCLYEGCIAHAECRISLETSPNSSNCKSRKVSMITVTEHAMYIAQSSRRRCV